MSNATAILITLVVYKVVLLGIGLIAERRTRDEADFLLGGRKLGPLVAAISASASSSSVWTLLGVSGFAYLQGLSAMWLLPACIGGFALNWYVIAPRMRRASAETSAMTLTDMLAGPRGRDGRALIAAVASVMTVLPIVVYVASQYQGAGKLFVEVFPTTDGNAPNETMMILVGAAIVVVYTLLGGFWAVSLTDTVQGLMMALTAVMLPVAAIVELGGPGALWDAIQGVPIAGYASVFGDPDQVVAASMVLGLLAIGLGYPGQPHVVNRFMALGDDSDVRTARRYAMSWAVLVYVGMILVGLSARVLIDPIDDGNRAFFALTTDMFSPVLAGIMLAAVLSALMSTVDSQLLVASAAISHDLATRARGALASSRLWVLVVSAVAVLVAVLTDSDIFKNVLSAWAAMGAAFGPLLVVTLWQGQRALAPSLLAMTAGFLGSVVVSATNADAWMTVLPYVGAYTVARAGKPARDG